MSFYYLKVSLFPVEVVIVSSLLNMEGFKTCLSWFCAATGRNLLISYPLLTKKEEVYALKLLFRGYRL